MRAASSGRPDRTAAPGEPDVRPLARSPVLALTTPTHDLLAHIQGSVGQPRVELFDKTRCRYCGATARNQFKNVSHMFPEALGNKWLVSLDECDACNQLFGRFDDALAKAIGPVLTIGGTKGKGNSVRKTGASKGPVSIRQELVDGKRRLSIQIGGDDAFDQASVDPVSGKVRFRVPSPTERFRPVLAYKAIVKMGIALLPRSELRNFSRLLAWLRAPDVSAIGPLTVGLSLGSLGNAPQLASAALLKRTSDAPGNAPYIIFIVSAGSLCFQLPLKSDDFDGPWPSQTTAHCALEWSNILSDGMGSAPIAIRYGHPVELDWTSAEPALSPITALVLDFDPLTSNGRWTAEFGGNAPPAQS